MLLLALTTTTSHQKESRLETVPKRFNSKHSPVKNATRKTPTFYELNRENIFFQMIKNRESPEYWSKKTNYQLISNKTTDVNVYQNKISSADDVRLGTKDNIKNKTFVQNIKINLHVPDSDKLNGGHYSLAPINASFIEFKTKSYLTKVPVNKIKSKIKNQNASSEHAEVSPDNGEDFETLQTSIVKKAVEYGLMRMKELYEIEEPTRYKMGVILEEDSPGRYLANFNFQNKEMEVITKYGFAALKASSMLKTELLKLRQEEEVNIKRFPFIPLMNTSLHDQCPLNTRPRCPSSSNIFRTSDGTCNNFDKPWWGATFQPLQRFLAPHYKDGLERVRESVRGGNLPSPRIISTFVHQDRDIRVSSVSHVLMQWGQFLDHDLISSAQSRGFNGSVPSCCRDSGRQFDPRQSRHPDCLPIEVPRDDWFYSRFGIRCLEFIRSAPTSRVGCALGYREQGNQATSFIDGSMIYGNSDAEADNLRLFRNGMLRYTRMQQRLPLLPSDPSLDFCRGRNENFFCFMTGDGRFTEQPGLLAFHTLFLRLHNRLTREMAHLNPHWSDERLFQEARKIVGAILQHVTYREFLPIVLGEDVVEIFGLDLTRDGYYKGYDTTVNPTVSNSFVSAAFRFGHSMVQGKLQRWDTERNRLVSNVTLHHEMMDRSEFHRFGTLDSLLLGMCFQPSQRRDEFITEELTNHLFESPRFPAGLDLAAMNIQRGRDHGIPSYNSWRDICGLREFENWEDLVNVMSSQTKNRLKQLYRHVNDIDLFTGGISEHPVRGGLVGSTFACIIAQQFRVLRKGDRFWYENGGLDSSFSARQLEQIRRVTMSRLLCDNLDVVDSIQPFAFLTVDDVRNQRVSCRSEDIPTFHLGPWREDFDVKNNLKSGSKEETMKPVPDVPKMQPDPMSLTEFPKPMKIDQDLLI